MMFRRQAGSLPRESRGMEVARSPLIRAFAPRSYTRKQTMFNLFKALFGRSQAAGAVSKSSTLPVALSRVEARPDRPSSEPSVVTHALRDDAIELPLQVIISRLPEAVQGQVRRQSRGASTLAFPSNMVLGLLKRGVVKL